MNVYVWESIAELTDNYHNSGGLVVVAASLEDARRMVDESDERNNELRKAHDKAYARLHKFFTDKKGGVPLHINDEWSAAYKQFVKDYPDGCIYAKKGAADKEPTAIYPTVPHATPIMYVFPDAGCC